MSAQRLLSLAGLSLIAALAGGCASGGASPPETPTPAAPDPAEAPEPVDEAPVMPTTETAPEPEASEPETPPETTEPIGAYGPKTVEVPGTEEEPEEAPQSLAEAARRARAERGDTSEPIAVITDETLSEYATGELTVATKPAASTPPPDDAALQDIQAQEEYWRTRVRDARIEWRDLEAEITELEGEVAQLRNRFYAEDDGFFRDSQIKPAWDRALDRLAEAQQEVIDARENLQEILEEGRRAGALPGWLREGLEYEPGDDEGDEGPGTHEPGEPTVVDEDGGE